MIRRKIAFSIKRQDKIALKVVSDNEVIRCQTDIVLTLFFSCRALVCIFNGLVGRQKELNEV